MNLEVFPFAKNGKEKGINLYRLSNDNDVEIVISNYGAAIISIITPDKFGNKADVVLGFDTIEEYENGRSFFGVICGRFANRIGNSSFSIDGINYRISANEGKNCLHGGINGFDNKIWNHIENNNEKNNIGVTFKYFSADNEESFPGNFNVTVTYTLNNENELSIVYEATTDKKTVVNLTNHSYFNLTGCKYDVQKHILKINSDKITEVNNELISTGKYINVAGTAYDFRNPVEIGKAISQNNGGFDNNFVITKKLSNDLSFAAKAIEPESGRWMETYTTEPAVQLYTANHMNGSQIGKKGVKYQKHFGFCLETQHYPDSPNHPEFPTTLLDPGEKYTQKTVYKFGVEK